MTAPITPDERMAYCPVHGDLLAGGRSWRCANAAPGHERLAPPPAWDEDTVTEQMAQRGFDAAAAEYGQDRYTDEQRHWATISEDERVMVRAMMTTALAVVRCHLPVRPDREAVERALRDAGLVEVEGCEAEEVVHAHLRSVVNTVLALLDPKEK